MLSKLFCNFEQKDAVSLCLPGSSPSSSLSRQNSSVYCLTITLTPCHCLYLLFELLCLSVSLSFTLLLSTLLACFCQTVFIPFLLVCPRFLSRHLLCLLFNRHFIIYNHICLCAHTPGMCLSWAILMMSSHIQVQAHTHARVHVSMHTHTHNRCSQLCTHVQMVCRCKM